jgi:predicted dehydrogenase
MSGDQTMAAPTRRSDPAAPPRRSIASRPLRVAAIGMGWWSDVLADAVVRSGKLEIASCFTRSEDKRRAFAAKYRCRAAASYDEILGDPEIEAIINTTPNDVHLETTRAAAAAGKHVFLDKPIANTVADARAITEACRKAGVVLALGYQRRRESQFRWLRQQIDAGALGRLVNAEANISRDRLGKVDLGSWRYTAAGMPGGVMLQIGIHYADVLEYLMGPIVAVSGRSARLVLPGDNPDVASLILEHESGALSTLHAHAPARRRRGGADSVRAQRHLRRGARGIRRRGARRGDAGGGRRVRDAFARGGARRRPVGTAGPPDRGRRGAGG